MAPSRVLLACCLVLLAGGGAWGAIMLAQSQQRVCCLQQPWGCSPDHAQGQGLPHYDLATVGLPSYALYSAS